MSIEEDNLHVTLHNEDGELPPEIIVRKGEALPQKEEQQLTVRGTIEAPYDYYVSMRDKDHMDFSNAIVTVDTNPDDPFIQLKVDPSDPKSPVIKGTMIEGDIIRELGVNNSDDYDNLHLANLLKMNRSAFKDIDVNTDLVHKLKEFSYQVEEERKNHDDDRGTRRVAMERIASTELPAEFELEVPIFKGLETNIVNINLLYQIKNEQMRFWLESPELKEQKREVADNLLYDQVGNFKDSNPDNIPIIYVG